MGAARRPAAQPATDLIWLRPDSGARDQRPALSRDQIVRAAVELADEHGLDAVSTRRIATALGSGPTSMYWHVPSKADLYELMFDAALGEVELPRALSGNWQADLRALARSTHLMLQRHPWLMLLAIQPELGPNTRMHLTSNDSFEFGLDCLLNGIALRFGNEAIPPGLADRDPGTGTRSRRSIDTEERPAGGG